MWKQTVSAVAQKTVLGLVEFPWVPPSFCQTGVQDASSRY